MTDSLSFSSGSSSLLRARRHSDKNKKYITSKSTNQTVTESSQSNTQEKHHNNISIEQDERLTNNYNNTQMIDTKILLTSVAAVTSVCVPSSIYVCHAANESGKNNSSPQHHHHHLKNVTTTTSTSCSSATSSPISNVSDQDCCYLNTKSSINSTQIMASHKSIDKDTETPSVEFMGTLPPTNTISKKRLRRGNGASIFTQATEQSTPALSCDYATKKAKTLQDHSNSQLPSSAANVDANKSTCSTDLSMSTTTTHSYRLRSSTKRPTPTVTPPSADRAIQRLDSVASSTSTGTACCNDEQQLQPVPPFTQLSYSEQDRPTQSSVQTNSYYNGTNLAVDTATAIARKQESDMYPSNVTRIFPTRYYRNDFKCSCVVPQMSLHEGTELVASHFYKYGEEYSAQCSLQIERQSDFCQKILQYADITLPAPHEAFFKSKKSNKKNSTNNKSSSDSSVHTTSMTSESSGQSASDTSSQSLSENSLPTILRTPVPGDKLRYRPYNEVEWRESDDLHQIEHEESLPLQPGLTTRMRCMVVHWLMEVVHDYNLSESAYHLAVSLLDQVLLMGPSKEQLYAWKKTKDYRNGDRKEYFMIVHTELQAVGCACLSIASKMEDRNPISQSDLVYVADHCFNKKQLQELELRICEFLKFRLQLATPIHFVDVLLRAGHACTNTSCLHQHNTMRDVFLYWLRLSRLAWCTAHQSPKALTAAAYLCARLVLQQRYILSVSMNTTDAHSLVEVDQGIWPKTLEYYSGYKAVELHGLVSILFQYHQHGEATQAKVFSLFKTAEHSYASTRPPPSKSEILKHFPYFFQEDDQSDSNKKHKDSCRSAKSDVDHSVCSSIYSNSEY